MISSTACGTVTLKSLLSLGSDAPHVHLRLRKRLSRCTLDCGFQTPESPALRGFVGGLQALATAALYLAFFFVLEKAVKSAGNAVIPTYPMHRSHGLQGFLKRCYTPLPYFHQWVSHIKRVLAQSSTKRPTFAFAGESGYTLGFRRKIAHKGSHGETGDVSDGGAIITLDTNRTFTNIPGPGVRTAYFAPFGSWSGVLPTNAESLGTAMRLCASLSRGVAAPPGCVIFSVSVEIAACTPCAQCFLCVRGGGGITTPGVLCVLLKHSAPACQKGSFAVF